MSDPRYDDTEKPFVCTECGYRWGNRISAAMCCDPAAPGEAD